jgi:hypothetical protein
LETLASCAPIAAHWLVVALEAFAIGPM